MTIVCTRTGMQAPPTRLYSTVTWGEGKEGEREGERGKGESEGEGGGREGGKGIMTCY